VIPAVKTEAAMRTLRTCLLALLAALLLLGRATAQDPQDTIGTGAPAVGAPLDPSAAQQQPPAPRGPSLSLHLGDGSEPERLTTAVEIVLLMTLLALAPAIVMTMTCFTRIIIVLSFLKRSMSMQELPPAMVVTGFAVFMTIFVMKPVATDVYEKAYVPYTEGKIGFEEAAQVAGGRMKEFMLRQTRPKDVELVLQLGREARPNTPDDLPFFVVVPAFILSEVKTAFQMGFVLFLPFVVIDLVISSILVSMGMFTLPPVVVSTPLKLLLFVMVDGWSLVVASLGESFAHP
jgi:flagellar biosynthetic protein FliP